MWKMAPSLSSKAVRGSMSGGRSWDGIYRGLGRDPEGVEELALSGAGGGLRRVKRARRRGKATSALQIARNEVRRGGKRSTGNFSRHDSREDCIGRKASQEIQLPGLHQMIIGSRGSL